MNKDDLTGMGGLSYERCEEGRRGGRLEEEDKRQLEEVGKVYQMRRARFDVHDLRAGKLASTHLRRNERGIRLEPTPSPCRCLVPGCLSL